MTVAFGIDHGVNTNPEILGTLLSSKYLGPDDSNVLNNITANVHIPSTLQKGKSTLTAYLFSLEGAEYSPITSTFQLTTTVGKFTSSQYVTSR